MIHVIAIITAKPGMATPSCAFRANMPAVHAEKGYIEYAPATDTPDIGKFQTPFGPDTHATAPHMAAYAVKPKDMIASRVIRVLSPAV